jgi:hypothetical protein
MIIRECPDACERKTKESRTRGETVIDIHKFPLLDLELFSKGAPEACPVASAEA